MHLAQQRHLICRNNLKINRVQRLSKQACGTVHFFFSWVFCYLWNNNPKKCLSTQYMSEDKRLWEVLTGKAGRSCVGPVHAVGCMDGRVRPKRW